MLGYHRNGGDSSFLALQYVFPSINSIMIHIPLYIDATLVVRNYFILPYRSMCVDLLMHNACMKG